MTEVTITSEYIRLDQFLKFAGIAQTGGAAKDMIAAGEVVIDEQPVLQRGKKLRDGCVLRAAGALYRVRGE
ncbi:MAG: RNA-binding S4 domain-containing protein [Oscillospiraceae bacterium]|nr:RNA-binding S4 domain-containing protein [Oscillospiraceae bacterium]